MFEREERNGRKEGEKEASQPHPDAQRNLEYTHQILPQIDVLEKSLSWLFEDCIEDENAPKRADGERVLIIKEPKLIHFDWVERGERWTGNRSFHVEHHQFRKEFCDAINFLLKKRFIKRRGVPIGSFKKSHPTANRVKNSFDELFGA